MNEGDLVIFVVIGVLGSGLIVTLRLVDQSITDARRVAWRLQFPTTTDHAGVLAFIRALQTMPLGGPLSGRPSLVFELRSAGGRSEHWLLVPQQLAGGLWRQIETALPGIQIEATDRPAFRPQAARELRLSTLHSPLRTVAPEEAVASLLASASAAGVQETIVLQVVVAPHRGRLVERSPRPSAPWPVNLWQTVLGRAPEGAPSRGLREKQSEPLLSATLRLGALAPSAQRAGTLVRSARASLRVVDQVDARLVQRTLPDQLVGRRLATGSTPVFEWPCVLNAKEVSLVVAWPVSEHSPGVERPRHRVLPVPVGLSQEGRIFGRSPLAGRERTVALSAEDSCYHTVCSGPTGVGKSTLLAQLMRQDMAAGRSVILFDPKGDLVHSVLDFVPAGRRVVVIDLTDGERPVPIHLLDAKSHWLDRSVDEVVSLFAALFPGTFGPRSADVLRATCHLIATTPGLTFADAPAILTNARLRQTLTPQVTDPLQRDFWSAFETYPDGVRAAVIGPVSNKLRAILGDRRLRNVLGQVEPTWSWDDVLEDRGIVLVNLNRGELGSGAASLVASTLMSQLWRAIQRRRARHEVSLVIDEAQDALRSTGDLADLLAMARSARVAVTVAHQNRAQLPAELLAALAANARSKVCFQSGIDDARAFAAQLGGGLTPADLTNLPAFEAYFAPCLGGAVQPPVSLRTLPLPPATADRGAVLRASRARFGRDRAEVERAMAIRQEGPTAAGPVGRRPRGGAGGAA